MNSTSQRTMLWDLGKPERKVRHRMAHRQLSDKRSQVNLFHDLRYDETAVRDMYVVRDVLTILRPEVDDESVNVMSTSINEASASGHQVGAQNRYHGPMR